MKESALANYAKGFPASSGLDGSRRRWTLERHPRHNPGRPGQVSRKEELEHEIDDPWAGNLRNTASPVLFSHLDRPGLMLSDWDSGDAWTDKPCRRCR